MLILACCGLAAEERFRDTGLVSLRVEFGIGDAEPTSGENYYYVRVQQVDGQLAWWPIWVTTDR